MSDAVSLTGPTRAQIEELEKYTSRLPQVDIVTEHRFEPGLYTRKMIVPADTTITGAVHRDAHLSIMLSGDITLNTPQGMERISGYHSWIAGAGTKRVGYTHQETVWITVHPTQCTDVASVEAEIFENPNTLLTRRQLAQLDFKKMLEETGFDEATVRAQSVNQRDQIPLLGHWPITVSPSMIEGNGLFATEEIEAHTLIAPARVCGMRTPAGRFTNHSPQPNAHMVANGHDVDLYAIDTLRPGDEILVDYRQSVAVARATA